jgi:hypothetical protein
LRNAEKVVLLSKWLQQIDVWTMASPPERYSCRGINAKCVEYSAGLVHSWAQRKKYGRPTSSYVLTVQMWLKIVK